MLPSFTQSFLKPKLKRQRPLTSKSYPRLNLERTEECMDVVDYAENNESENLSKRQRPNERCQVIRIPALDLFDQHQYQHAQATSVEASMLTKPTSRPDFFGPFGASSSSSYNECNSSLKPQSGTSGHSLITRQQITRKQSFIVKGREMRAFFRLLEDESVQDFLEADSCMRISDKYLIAMVFAYFKRAELKIREYTRTNFFVALYLGNDMEEDEEEDKYEIFPWALGLKWQDKFPRFLKKRDLMWSKINYMALVSKRCCEEIMAIDSSHPVWKRTRPIHHAGALRSYMRDPDDDGYPRGPHASPRHCEECNHDSQYDSASPASVSWFISSGENSPTSENDIFDEPRKSRFDMNKLKNDLPQQDDHDDDDAWPSVEE